MDYVYAKNKNMNDDSDILFGTKFSNLPTDSDIMDTNWSNNPDDILDSIFSMDNDFLSSFDNTQEFDTLEDLSARIKMEAEEYETISALTYSNNASIDKKIGNISSTSSDSGLSSDNLDLEMSPTYQSLSPTFPYPVPPNSERWEKSNVLSLNNTTRSKNTEERSKVVVQKVPQVLTLSTKNSVKQKLHLSNNREMKIVKISPHMFNTYNKKAVTIQVKNSNTGAKIQANPGTLFLNNIKVTEAKKLGKGQNGLNSRSILIPVSLTDVKDLKSFKILNSTTFKKIVSNTSKTKKIALKEKFDDTISENSSDNESVILGGGCDYNDNNFVENIQYAEGKKYPKLMLSQEERRLLSKEGITLPSHYPLTKNEERELKRIRRKIRNKISAQDSRKRKKEYVDGLEERVKQCTEENQTLLKRIKLLQNQNQSLATQMKKLQSLITKGSNKTAHPTTCLMVLLLSLALVAVPNLKLGKNIQEHELDDFVEESIIQNRRNLLFDFKDQSNEIIDELNMSDIFGLSNLCETGTNFVDTSSKNKISQLKPESCCKKFKPRSEIIDFEVDDQNWYKTTANYEKKSIIALDNSFKLNMKTSQSSGFNIGNMNDIFDQDGLRMITPNPSAFFGSNLDKSGVHILINTPYNHKEDDKKLNISEAKNY